MLGSESVAPEVVRRRSVNVPKRLSAITMLQRSAPQMGQNSAPK